MDAKLKETIENLNTTFAAFKASNDKQYEEVKATGVATAETKAAVDKANNDITLLQASLAEQRAALREVENANARMQPLTAGDARDQEVKNAREFFSLTRGVAVQNVTDDDMGAYRKFKSAQAQWLRFGDKALGDVEIRNAMSTGVSTEGGYWLVPETSNRIVEWIEDISSLRSAASVSSIGTDTYEGVYDLDEADSGWVGETEARTGTNNPRVDGKFSFPIHEQYAEPKTTQKMLDDSQNDVEGWLAKKVGTRLGKQENSSFVNGNGVKRPKGFLTYAAGTPARTSVPNYRKIRQFNTGAAGAFLTPTPTVNPGDKFIDIISTMPSELRRGAQFAMNQLTLAEVRKIKDAEGRYIFIPDFASNPAGSILGYGILDLSDMPNIEADSLSIAFANFKEAYEIKDHRVGIRVLRDPFTDKPYVKFYTTKRVGGDVVNFQAIHIMKFAA